MHGTNVGQTQGRDRIPGTGAGHAGRLLAGHSDDTFKAGSVAKSLACPRCEKAVVEANERQEQLFLAGKLRGDPAA